MILSVKWFQRKPAEVNTRSAAAPAAPDEATSSEFTEIPLSTPYQSPEEERHEPDAQLETTTHPSDELSEELESSSSHILAASLSNVALQSKQTKPNPGDLTESSRDEAAARQDEEHKATNETTDLVKDTQLWNLVQFQIPNAPTAPALYPCLATLEESSEIHLCEANLKNPEWEPAVLALPEQESSPPSLQLESVAEIPRSKLYPQLPKTAPELQVT